MKSRHDSMESRRDFSFILPLRRFFRGSEQPFSGGQCRNAIRFHHFFNTFLTPSSRLGRLWHGAWERPGRLMPTNDNRSVFPVPRERPIGLGKVENGLNAW
jgi:hypothetical protein